jgi:hypothetical protein
MSLEFDFCLMHMFEISVCALVGFEFKRENKKEMGIDI